MLTDVNMRMLSVLIFVCVVPNIVSAQVEIRALVTDAYDGDTLTVEASIWPDVIWDGNVRVLGVDTPEINRQCAQERVLALAARDFVRELLIDESVNLTNIENDKFGGRIVADVQLESGENLADLLIANDYGRRYDGGARESWCDGPISLPRETSSNSRLDDSSYPLRLYDDNGNGRISCAEAQRHGIVPVYSWHPAYPYMTDRDGDGVICE